MRTRLALLLALGVLACAPAGAAGPVPTVPLDRGWEYLLLAEEWGPGELPRPPDDAHPGWRPEVKVRELRGAGQAWLRVRLPPGELEEPGLFFWSHRAVFALYLDGEPIYRWGRPRADAPRPRLAWHFVPLPPEAAGKTLRVARFRPVPGSISPREWMLAPRGRLGELIAVQVRRVVLDDLDNLVFGPVVLGVGLAAIAVFFFRRRRAELAPLYFGAFALLYGLRLLAGADLVHVAADLQPGVWDNVARVITYSINVPSILFFEQFYGRGWRSTIRRLWQLHVVFAVTAIALGVATGDLDAAMPVNSYLVLLTMAVALGHVFGPRVRGIPEAPAFRLSFLVLAVFVVNENLVAAGLVPWRASFEELGFFVFLCGLGYALARRILGRERQLLAVEQELETARQIQTSILPSRMPEIEGVRLAVAYRPVASVAGDFYDFLTPSARQLGILVADVAGHGVPAALIASMVKASLTAQAGLAGDPARLLLEMNRTLHGSLEKRFVTAAYLLLDAARGEAVYAAGGHPPPLLWRASARQVEELPGRGPILGRFPDARYSATTCPLAPGDRIYLFTDGIVEAAGGGGEQFGESRLRRFIAADHELAPERFVLAFLGHLDAWTKGVARPEHDDDLTLVAVEYSGR